MKIRDIVSIPPAVQWHEGLLLEPQHFQELARRGERLLDYHLGLASPYHYGVVACEFDGTLSSGVLRIRKLEAVMPDGLVVAHPFPGTSQANELTLKFTPAEVALATHGSAIVYLVVAREGIGPTDEPRYDTGATAEARDEGGEGSIEVPRLAPILKLRVGQGPPALPVRPQGVALPLCQVRLGNNVLERVEEYEPPRLRLDAASPVSTFCRNEIVEPLRIKAGRLARAAMALSESNQVEAARKLRFERQVQSLVAGLPPIEALLDAGAPHPFQAYLAFAALIGQLAAAAHDLIPPAPSNQYPYEHEDPASTFRRIAEVVAGVRDSIQESFAAYRLVHDASTGRFQVRLPAEWRGRVLGLGVRARADQPGVQVARWMRESRICVFSPQRLEELEMRRATGARRAPRGEAPDARAKERLNEIAPPPGSEVYWVDEQSPDLGGDGPFMVASGGPASQQDAFELTLYVAYADLRARRTGAEG